LQKGKAVRERYKEGRGGRKALLRRRWSYKRVTYSKGVLGATRILVNYKMISRLGRGCDVT
jgi:hypothetical protein